MQIRTLDRHKKFQIMISTGTVVGFGISLLFPHMAFEYTMINLFTTMMWIWEH